NLARVEEQIAAACHRANRPRESVHLMAVSKTHPSDAIIEAYAAGVRLFGENRVQEYADKRGALQAAGIFAGQLPAIAHCIGPLQSNKAARAAQIFDSIDSVDSLRLADRLNKAAAEANQQLPIFIEIKLGSEESKHGLAPEAAELTSLLEQLPNLTHLQLRGLMTVPPYADDLEQARP
ncbi:pyridoxal phosphate enzyme, YggS family, partial [mine drainage metagenome]